MGYRVLEGKVALVTGSTAGIGAEIARALAEQGCDIALHGLGEATGIEAQRVKLQETYGVRVTYSSADLREGEQAVDAIFSQVGKQLGSVSILVNNAGIQHVSPLESFPSSVWETMVLLHLSVPFYATRLAIPLMRVGGWGRIVNIASVQGLVGSIHKAGYVATKHGVVGLTKVVALETAEEAITCNAICPGFVDTELARQQVRARAEEEGISEVDAQRVILREKQPCLRFVGVEDIAAMVLYLCSEAARYVTGSSLSIDGGWYAR